MRSIGIFVTAIFWFLGATLVARAETVGGIVFINTKHDGSFNELAAIGSERAAAEFGFPIREWTSTERDETLNVLRQFAKGGVTHILALGYENSEAVRTVASEHPDVKFTLIDGAVSDMPNVRSIVFADEESGFIVGYVAGLKTKTGKVGTIGGVDIPPVRRFMCGFAAGAKHANADILVLSSFVGNDMYAFRDIQGGVASGSKMFSAGADVIFAPAGMAAEGVAKAAEEASGHVIMVDANKNAFIPGTVLTSAMKRVDEAAYTAWKAIVDGSWTPGISIMSTRDKGVDWAVDDYNKAMVADIKHKVDQVTAGLAAGQIEIDPVDEIAGCADVL